jgi:hypothetical protein
MGLSENSSDFSQLITFLASVLEEVREKSELESLKRL